MLHIHRLRLPFQLEAQGFELGNERSTDDVRLPLKPGPATLGSGFVKNDGLRKSRESCTSAVSVFLSDPKRRASDRWRTMVMRKVKNYSLTGSG